MSNVIPVNLEDTNEVRLAGKIEKPLEFSHKTNSERFFKTSIIIKRLSGVCDVIPLVIPNKIVDNMIRIEKGMFVELAGRFQSRKEGEKVKSFVFCQEMWKVSEETYKNRCSVCGSLYLTPKFHTTGKGVGVTYMSVIAARKFNRADFLPCICWNGIAEFARNLPEKTRVCGKGRLQSRQGTKNDAPHTFYEISLSGLMKIEDAKKKGA
nr:MAG TPA: single-stranded DNA-binding protein [Caudoviricetes sp.]